MSASEGLPMSVPERAVMPAPPAIPVRRVRRILLAAGAVFAVLFLVGVVPRLMLRYRLRAAATAVQQQPPAVSTVSPQRAPEVIEVPFPGSIQSILHTGIWTRTNGYLKSPYLH